MIYQPKTIHTTANMPIYIHTYKHTKKNYIYIYIFVTANIYIYIIMYRDVSKKCIYIYICTYMLCFHQTH